MIDDALYPELNEHGKKAAQRAVNKLKIRLAAVCKEVIGDFYTNIGDYIEADSWVNYRNSIMSGLKNYGGDIRWDYKKVREEIFKEHREDIIKDINQDLLDEIDGLKAQLKREETLRNWRG